MHNSALIINKTLFENNIASILGELPEGCSLIPVIKADAYGLGVENIVPFLAGKVPMFAVAHVSEGIKLREIGVKDNVLVLGNPVIECLDEAIENNLTLSVCRRGFAQLLPEGYPVHIGFNSGLNRIGIEEYEMDDVIWELKDHPLNITGGYSHHGDFDRFIQMAGYFEAHGISLPMKHYCDSAGFEEHPEHALDGVRLGRRLFMDAAGKTDTRIKEVATWKASVTDINYYTAGQRLGYSHVDSLVLDKDTKAAIISIGYADGLHYKLIENKVPVLLNGKRCPILYSFMDQTLIDVTGVDCKIGDSVVIFGYDDEGNLLSSQDMALIAGCDEGVSLYCTLSPRVERYVL